MWENKIEKEQNKIKYNIIKKDNELIFFGKVIAYVLKTLQSFCFFFCSANFCFVSVFYLYLPFLIHRKGAWHFQRRIWPFAILPATWRRDCSFWTPSNFWRGSWSDSKAKEGLTTGQKFARWTLRRRRSWGRAKAVLPSREGRTLSTINLRGKRGKIKDDKKRRQTRKKKKITRLFEREREKLDTLFAFSVSLSSCFLLDFVIVILLSCYE